jgi:hypothetical protein
MHAWSFRAAASLGHGAPFRLLPLPPRSLANRSQSGEIVARQGTATYGLARQLATLFDFDGASVHIAESYKEASAWLDQMRSGERHADKK